MSVVTGSGGTVDTAVLPTSIIGDVNLFFHDYLLEVSGQAPRQRRCYRDSCPLILCRGWPSGERRKRALGTFRNHGQESTPVGSDSDWVHRVDPASYCTRTIPDEPGECVTRSCSDRRSARPSSPSRRSRSWWPVQPVPLSSFAPRSVLGLATTLGATGPSRVTLSLRQGQSLQATAGMRDGLGSAPQRCM